MLVDNLKECSHQPTEGEWSNDIQIFMSNWWTRQARISLVILICLCIGDLDRFQLTYTFIKWQFILRKQSNFAGGSHISVLTLGHRLSRSNIGYSQPESVTFCCCYLRQFFKFTQKVTLIKHDMKANQLEVYGVSIKFVSLLRPYGVLKWHNTQIRGGGTVVRVYLL